MSPEFSTALLATGPSSLHGRSFLFKGQLLAHNEGVFVRVGDGNDMESLRVTEPGFLDRVLDAVPCLVGGWHFYNDSVVLEGQVEVRGQELTIARVATGGLYRKGETYSF